MVMPPRSCSSGMQSVRRELQRRRPKTLAPKRSVAKKPSAPQPPPPPREGADPSSTASKSAGTHAPRHRPHPSMSPAVISPSTPPPRSNPCSAGSAGPSTLGADEHLRPGTEVGVRTRTTTLKTGEVLVLWLRATIVSPTNGGYEVVYDGNWPPGDPYGTVHVPRRHVRTIEPSPSPMKIPPPSSAPSSSASDTAAATVAAVRKEEMRPRPAPRPTTAGKSLRLIRSLWPEIKRQARAA